MENKGSRDAVFRVRQHSGQCIVPGVVLAALDFKWQHISLMLNDEIKFPLFFAVKIIQLISVSSQLLRGGIFKHCSKVDVFLSVQQCKLDSIGIGSRQQSHIA